MSVNESGTFQQTSADGNIESSDELGQFRYERADSITSDGMEDSLLSPGVFRTSIVDDLLFEIYDRWHDARHDSFESDTFTECSSTSDVFPWRKNSINLDIEAKHCGKLNSSALELHSTDQLKKMKSELQYRNNCMSARLVRQLKRRERRLAKLQHNFDIVTAILQASSQKRRIDTRMKFSIEPPPGDSAFDQWKDAMKAVARLPLGIPESFRKKVWLSLADDHIRKQRVDWQKTMRFVFNEKSNPDDNNLGHQIVKDLHRTGCSGFSGHENEEDRASLKRVLLGFARWNKSIGYCQGFNVIAALLLDVTERREDDALKVMIYIIDHVLPESYYMNNLRALSVDMAVFRDLLRITFPKLSRHLDVLQNAAQDNTTGACYEPPLTNVFTMQWFLTMFATCLPKDIVLRVWDSLLLEGSEILLRTGLAIWGKLSRRILSAGSADEFYSLMGVLTQDMMAGKMFTADSLIKSIYTTAAFDSHLLVELREKYTYNIRPFSSSANTNNSNKNRSFLSNMLLPSDEDDIDEEDLEAINCFPGFFPVPVSAGKAKGNDDDNMADISKVGPGAYGASGEALQLPSSVYMERMCTDISSLKKQYDRLKQRQNQAHIIIAAASATQQQQQKKAKIITPKIETPTALNHLFVGRNNGSRNRCVAASPRIASVYPQLHGSHPQPGSRKNSVSSGSRLDPQPVRQGSKSPSTVLDTTIENKNVHNENNAHKTTDNNHNVKISNQGMNEDLHAQESAAQTNRIHSSSLHGDDNISKCNVPCNGSLVDSTDISKCDSSLDSHDRVNGMVTSSHGEENQSRVERSNSNGNNDSLEAGSEGFHIGLDSSNDSGLFSGTSSTELRESSQSDAPSTRASDNDLTNAQQKSNININGQISASNADNNSKASVVSRSVSEDVSSQQEADDSMTSRSRSFSTDQALSDYARSKNRPAKTAQPFNPFPVKHFNENRKKNCVKLGLYKTSTLQEFERQCKNKFVWSK